MRKKEEVTEETDIDSQVAAMAEDKEIQMELEKIDREFIVSELDGLGIKIRNGAKPESPGQSFT